MNGRALILLLVFVVLVSGSEGCRKKQQSNTIFSMLQGKWKRIQLATDDNGNGIIDASELHNMPPGYSDVLLFKSDSTGMETTLVNNGSPNIIPYNWRPQYSDSLLINYRAHLSIDYYIVVLNSSLLTLSSYVSLDSGFILTQYVYNKE